MVRRRYVITTLMLALCSLPSLAAAQDEGIKVHGHWVVEVREAGGALVRRAEFSNALAGGGRLLLARALGQDLTVRDMHVVLVVGNGVVSSGTPSTQGFHYCDRMAVAQGLQGCALRSVERAPTAGGLGLELTKTRQGGTSGFTITRVATLFRACPVDPAVTCAEPAVYGLDQLFSEAEIPGGLLVQPGQTLNVRVTFTFS